MRPSGSVVATAVVPVALVLALVLGACSGSKGKPVMDLQPGLQSLCLEITDKTGAEISKLPVIACDKPHSHEVYDVYVVTPQDADAYPGNDSLERIAKRECVAAFEPFVGISAFDSSLFFSWMVPSLKSWNDDDDRQVICVLGAHDGHPLTGSMRGTRQ
jgi:hypothetical protein